MICVTETQLRAAMTDLELRYRANPQREADMAYWLAQPVEATVEATLQHMLAVLKEHGVKQKIE